jgi:hypothetical protein
VVDTVVLYRKRKKERERESKNKSAVDLFA